jgi:ATP-dependent DNA helicase 2 subunit 2
MHPPSDLLAKAKPTLEALIKAADIKKVPPKQKGRFRKKDAAQPISGLDVDALLTSTGKRTGTISAANAVPEFKQAVGDSTDDAMIERAVTQMGTVIEQLIRASVGNSGYERALEAMRVFREEMVEVEQPGLYNDWLRGFKTKVLGGELGGDRKEAWWRVRREKLGLIGNELAEGSEVSPEEGAEFYKITS